MISVVQVYLEIHVVSTKFSFVIAFLSLYFFHLNHLVMGLIIVIFLVLKYIYFSCVYFRVLLILNIFCFTFFLPNNLGVNLPFFCLFITLARVTLFYLLLEGFSYAKPVYMLANHLLHTIYSRM